MPVANLAYLLAVPTWIARTYFCIYFLDLKLALL
jgi:hypothetical protein